MTTTILKILAVIFMTIDHVGEFLPDTPIFFRWIGLPILSLRFAVYRDFYIQEIRKSICFDYMLREF